MNQSNIIAAYLFAAFVIYITMRGELRTYLGFFFGGGASPVASGSPTTAPQSSANTANSASAPGTDLAQTSLTTAVQLLPLLGL